MDQMNNIRAPPALVPMSMMVPQLMSPLRPVPFRGYNPETPAYGVETPMSNSSSITAAPRAELPRLPSAPTCADADRFSDKNASVTSGARSFRSVMLPVGLYNNVMSKTMKQVANHLDSLPQEDLTRMRTVAWVANANFKWISCILSFLDANTTELLRQRHLGMMDEMSPMEVFMDLTQTYDSRRAHSDCHTFLRNVVYHGGMMSALFRLVHGSVYKPFTGKTVGGHSTADTFMPRVFMHFVYSVFTRAPDNTGDKIALFRKNLAQVDIDVSLKTLIAYADRFDEECENNLQMLASTSQSSGSKRHAHGEHKSRGGGKRQFGGRNHQAPSQYRVPRAPIPSQHRRQQPMYKPRFGHGQPVNAIQPANDVYPAAAVTSRPIERFYEVCAIDEASQVEGLGTGDDMSAYCPIHDMTSHDVSDCSVVNAIVKADPAKHLFCHNCHVIGHHTEENCLNDARLF